MRTARSDMERAIHNDYVAEHGGRPAPPRPPPQPQQLSAAQRLARDGMLICEMCGKIPLLVACFDEIVKQQGMAVNAAAANL